MSGDTASTPRSLVTAAEHGARDRDANDLLAFRDRHSATEQRTSIATKPERTVERRGAQARALARIVRIGNSTLTRLGHVEEFTAHAAKLKVIFDKNEKPSARASVTSDKSSAHLGKGKSRSVPCSRAPGGIAKFPIENVIEYDGLNSQVGLSDLRCQTASNR